jgi:PhnB protein
MQVQPYLNFDGRCEEALNFYRKAIGAEVTALMRMNESPEPPPPGTLAPENGNKVMHSTFRVGETTIMASDCGCEGKTGFQGFSLAIGVPTPADADRLFAALADGGKVHMPLGKTFWSPRFGVVADKFGVAWMISTNHS